MQLEERGVPVPYTGTLPVAVLQNAKQPHASDKSTSNSREETPPNAARPKQRDQRARSVLQQKLELRVLSSMSGRGV